MVARRSSSSRRKDWQRIKKATEMGPRCIRRIVFDVTLFLFQSILHAPTVKAFYLKVLKIIEFRNIYDASFII